LENANLYLSLVSTAGIILVAVAAIVVWRQKTNLSYRWFRFFVDAGFDGRRDAPQLFEPEMAVAN
jgi:hypothetical protein